MFCIEPSLVRLKVTYYFLDPSEKQKNQYDQKDNSDSPAGPVTPISAIGPAWHGANHQKNQDY